MGKKAQMRFKKLKNFRKDHKSNLNIFIVCVSVIMIWRGIWDLLESYIFPNNPLLSNLICIVLGILILLIDDGKLGELEEEHHKTK